MASTATPTLQSICSIDDIFHRHLLPFLSHQDAGRLEQTGQALKNCVQWKILCERDFDATSQAAPVYNQERRSFDTFEPTNTWKEVYQKWCFWKQWTHGGATAQHMKEAVEVWARLKAVLIQHDLHNILHSLSPCLETESFAQLSGKAPSSLLALYSVHGGQELLRPRSQDHEFFAGLFGSYSCYNDYYSMRLLKMFEFQDTAIQEGGKILIGVSPGNPRMYLYLCPTDDDPEGHVTMVCNNPMPLQSIQLQQPIVGQGILSYMRQYVEHLESGVYKPAQIIEESESARGIGLFPDGGDLMSRCVTQGIEVRASARWFPAGIRDQHGLNFGYSIRMKMLAEDGGTCQLVGRHWEFMDGAGTVRRVDGEAVIGKQPLFFRRNGKSGYIDLGPAGDGDQYEDKVFVYQSQSGPVEDTTQLDTKQASVKGTFSFRPGSIDNPTGPLFHVTVAEFPFEVPTPFY